MHILDEGPGFAAADFPKLFIAEAKLTAKPTGSETSTGFGLHSLKSAVDSFDGEVEVKNNADRGACVTIRFPLSMAVRSVGAPTRLADVDFH